MIKIIGWMLYGGGMVLSSFTLFKMLTDPIDEKYFANCSKKTRRMIWGVIAFIAGVTIISATMR